MSSHDANLQSKQPHYSPEAQRSDPNYSTLGPNPNHANAPSYTSLGPPKNLLKPIQPSGSYNPITLPPLTTEGPLDPEAEASAQAVSGQRWEVRPRPRPGRKLATDAPDTKRKQQNREAQRAFRERRAQRVNELEQELQRVKSEHRNSFHVFWQSCEDEKNDFMKKWREDFCGAVEEDKNRMAAQLRRKDDEILRKDTEIQYWKEKAQKAMGMDSQLTPPPYGSGVGHPFNNPSPSMVVPSIYPSLSNMNSMAPPTFSRPSYSDNPYASTNYRANLSDPFSFRTNLSDPRTGQQGPRTTTNASTSGFGTTSSTGVSESCGNCTEDNCPCVDELVDDSNASLVRHPSTANPPISPSDSRTFAAPDASTDPSGREIDFTSTSSRKVDQQASEPGSCANCQANPDQRQFCQALHQSAKQAEQPRQLKDKESSVTSQALSPALRLSINNGRMSCDDTYGVLFPNRNFSLDSNYSEFMKELLTLPPSRRDSAIPGMAPQRTAMDVECASVLDLMRSSGPVLPPGHMPNPLQAASQGQGHVQEEDEQEPDEQN